MEQKKTENMSSVTGNIETVLYLKYLYDLLCFCRKKIVPLSRKVERRETRREVCVVLYPNINAPDGRYVRQQSIPMLG